MSIHPGAQLIDAGSVIDGRYELTARLGEGGFARVWRAHDHNTGRQVAVKVLGLERLQGQPDLRRTVLERFAQEARIAASVEHPNVVRIFDYGTFEAIDTPFIVMELMEGHDLETQIFERPFLPAERALPLFAGCLDALGWAHKKGVVHKDLKPGNVFFANPNTPDEAFRLLDFGTAFLDNAAAGRLTATGEILGTPQYMAPEYIDEQVVSPALDVYQMGLILAELLSGRPVVDAPTPMACMLEHLSGEYELPRALMQSAVGPVLQAALQTDPAERFEDAAAFARALRQVDASQVPAIPPGKIPMARPSTTQLLAPGAYQDTVQMSLDPQRAETLRGLGGPRLDELQTVPGISADLARRLVELDDALVASEADDDLATRKTQTWTKEPPEVAPRTETVPPPAQTPSRRTMVIAVLVAAALLLGGATAWLLVDAGSSTATKPAKEVESAPGSPTKPAQEINSAPGSETNPAQKAQPAETTPAEPASNANSAKETPTKPKSNVKTAKEKPAKPKSKTDEASATLQKPKSTVEQTSGSETKPEQKIERTSGSETKPDSTTDEASATVEKAESTTETAPEADTEPESTEDAPYDWAVAD
ncbi:serine/threonine protein kinase [Persicimonas caeni]|uniref:serine/threonine protein kinase n=1 Tax=Persicimonas caeni TaxID=2292766 RepID=UPI00143CF953|nr:serine/threonine protein kinase [Persicimonas caeni]